MFDKIRKNKEFMKKKKEAKTESIEGMERE